MALNKRDFYKHAIYWIASILAIKVLVYFPKSIELVYAQNIYPVIAIVNRWFFRFFSFSFGDLLYFFGFAYFLYLIFQLIVHIRKPLLHIRNISSFLLKTLWLFYVSWGLNYFRQPLSESLDLSTKKYTMTELLQVTDSLISRSNHLQLSLSKSDTLAVEVPYGIEHILQKTPAGYKAIEHIIGQKYRVACVKKSLFSKQISYMSVSGYLNPFTGEAQVNYLYPKVFLPDIASHEVAHQLGYAPENEANFLGYLAATHHPDPYFNYAGNIDALYYFLIELRKADKDKFKQYVAKLHKGVLKNFKEANEFSKRYRFPIDFSSTYDAYLKANNQASGIHSYNEMVALVIAYELARVNVNTPVVAL